MISLRTRMHPQVYRDRFIPSRYSSNFDLGTRSQNNVLAARYRDEALFVL